MNDGVTLNLKPYPPIPPPSYSVSLLYYTISTSLAELVWRSTTGIAT